jgi:hypothetical protein
MRDSLLHRIALAAGGLLACITLDGCIIIGSSRHGGFFLWPRGFGLLILVIIVIALMRPRRW